VHRQGFGLVLQVGPRSTAVYFWMRSLAFLPLHPFDSLSEAKGLCPRKMFKCTKYICRILKGTKYKNYAIEMVLLLMY
jgi:hypothetical protein